ncbi:MAG: hypothetical protein ABEI52_12595, partial [Halobacteriaceae archaeon]
DPKTQAVEGLIYEPKRTQVLGSPMDVTAADWSNGGLSALNANVASAKSQNYDEIVEDTSTGTHFVLNAISVLDGEPVAFSAIVKMPSGSARDWIRISAAMQDTGGDTAYFDLTNGVTGTAETTNTTLIEHAIEDLGGGWYRVRWVAVPDASDNRFLDYQLGLAAADGDLNYTGDGSSNLYIMHAQAEASREVTSPILTGGGVREADTVDYRFSFPDKTTGIAYAIKQEAGGSYLNVGNVIFGTTSNSTQRRHGVLMDTTGVNGLDSDGWKKVTRNSDDNDVDGRTVLDETVDRFQVRYPGDIEDPVYIIRQIAIHTAPHTSTQLSDLESNYLTTP